MDTSETKRFWQGIELTRSIDQDMPIQYLSALLLIALKESIEAPLEILDLSKILNITEASASRAASYLSEVGYRGKKGLGFIRKEEDVMDRRRKKLKLTLTGRGFLYALNDAIKGTLHDKRREEGINAEDS